MSRVGSPSSPNSMVISHVIFRNGEHLLVKFSIKKKKKKNALFPPVTVESDFVKFSMLLMGKVISICKMEFGSRDIFLAI